MGSNRPTILNNVWWAVPIQMVQERRCNYCAEFMEEMLYSFVNILIYIYHIYLYYIYIYTDLDILKRFNAQNSENLGNSTISV
jgi:hypothetical protein